jgi:hypothetical protein
MKYIVEVKYTNPAHEHVSLRRRVDTVSRVVEARSEAEAINRVANQQRALGYMIKEAKVLQPASLNEGFDTDPKDIAAYLVNRHGKGKVTMDHIEAYERRRDSHRPIEKNAVMQHVKKMSEEVEQVNEKLDSDAVASGKRAREVASSIVNHLNKDREEGDKLKISPRGHDNGNKEYYIHHEQDPARDGRSIFHSPHHKKFAIAGTQHADHESAVAHGIKYFNNASPKGSSEKDRIQKKKDEFKQRVEQVDEADVTKNLRASLKMMDLRHGVDSDKRDAGYKMSPAVRAAQKKSDVLSKVVKRPQAGTLAAVHKSMEREMQKESVEYIEEKLTAANPASEWIKDFVASDNPEFAGRSKKERIQMALEAYYDAKRGKNEEAEKHNKSKMKHAEKEQERKKGSMNKIDVEPKMETNLPGAINSWPGVGR